MQLELGQIHVWSTDLRVTPEQESIQIALLSHDEKIRAQRFHFPIHRQRFTAARATLRQIISLYLQIPPQDIAFAYSEHNKPSLLTASPIALQFNLSHSHDRAVYAFTLKHAIGIDIEKVEKSSHASVAGRYFSQQENNDLLCLGEEEAVRGFYRIWSRKEALVKAVGKGLSTPLSSFSVSLQHDTETLTLENETWSLLSLPIHQDYESALASNQMIKKISYWRLIDQQPKLDNESYFCTL